MDSSKHLYAKIAVDLKRRIKGGEFPAGERIPSVTELCAAYKVCQRTALNVFKALAKDGIIRKSEGNGYFVIAGGGEGGGQPRKYAIGCFLRPLIAHNNIDIYFNQVHSGLQSQLLASGYTILTPPCVIPLNILNPPERALAAISGEMLARASCVDGFVVDERIPDSLLEPVFRETGKPMIIVNRRSSLPVDTIMPIAGDGVDKAADAAVKLGYERFIAIAGKRRFDREDRSGAYAAALAGRGVHQDAIEIIECANEYFSDTVRRAVGACQAASPLKTIVFATDDHMAAELVTTFLRLGRAVGKDVGVVGYGGLHIAKEGKLEVSTIDTQPEKLGAAAAEALVIRISHETGGMKFAEPGPHGSEVTFRFGQTI